MKVFLSELAETKLLKLSEYLLENWNIKTRDKFISKLTEKIKQISIQPESCPKSFEFENLYKCVVTKQTTFYYRINSDKQEVEIITIFDTRQNPERLNEDIE
ncbi:type II toxin-antitoxin system RelE/ParE family toxin [Polaribacter sp. WD7]|uniref:type II toxin-antitoxin system RelE/ParE family toxin n=1 Tax=Polaribacter sp. WD7 TaxID=2269061 RepID=UPI000DF21AC1|nr:type II toxin-antitoxin system RelE/ParE family toxin [Polaribacter sp. WD7]RCS28536.1 type II toxin-antitoxin system RelE/ParE family toxin [Polaribacter sp. WD7]